MSNITHYGYTPEQIKGMADEIERLRIKELELIHACEDKDGEIARLLAALKEMVDWLAQTDAFIIGERDGHQK